MKYTQKLPSLGLPFVEQVLQAQSYLRKCQGVIPATGRGDLSLFLLLSVLLVREKGAIWKDSKA